MLNPIAKLLGSAELDEFAKSLATIVSDRYSSDKEKHPTRRDDKRLGRALKIMEDRVREFKKGRRLGVYGKARVCNTFKWELKELGYTEQFVEAATKDLVMRLG